MKPSRRHELKTNELSVFLQQTYASAKQNRNYVIGGVVLVVGILIVGYYVQSRRHQSRDAAWDELRAVQSEIGKPSLEVLNRAKDLASAQAGSSDLGARTATLVGDVAYELALTEDMVKQPAKQLELLREARKQYESVIKDCADQAEEVAAARYRLAKTEESLIAFGEGTKAAVLAQYEILAKAEHGTFKLLAEQAMETLDERLQPLKLVATRPAETPATQPTTAPAIPSAEAPAVAPVDTTAPATAPATTQPTP